MADLTFIYGTMESGKTTKLLQDNFNYRRHKHNVVIAKPKLDIKGGNTVTNRTNDAAVVDILIDTNETFLSGDYLKKILDAEMILVDEAQFLPEEQIKDLWALAHLQNIPVFCYGLLSDFQGHLFEGASILVARADNKTELKTSCMCGKRQAVFNARKINDEFVADGASVAIDGFKDVTYAPLCGDCYASKVEGFKTIEDAIQRRRKINKK